MKIYDDILRELALAISLVSLGSNQTLFLPHFSTAEANRFCNLSVLKKDKIWSMTTCEIAH